MTEMRGTPAAGIVQLGIISNDVANWITCEAVESCKQAGGSPEDCMEVECATRDYIETIVATAVQCCTMEEFFACLLGPLGDIAGREKIERAIADINREQKFPSPKYAPVVKKERIKR